MISNFYLSGLLLLICALLIVKGEAKYKLLNKIGGVILALFLGIILAQLNILSPNNKFVSFVWSDLLALSIPMLLLKSNLAQIKDATLKLFKIACFSMLATLLMAIISGYILAPYIKNINEYLILFTSTYVGGTINIMIMAKVFNISNTILSNTILIDNFTMLLYFILLAFMARNHKKTIKPVVIKTTKFKVNEFIIYLLLCFTILFIATSISNLITTLTNQQILLHSIIRDFIGNKYLLLTSFTLIVAALLKDYYYNKYDYSKFGIIIIYIFFIVIGLPINLESLKDISIYLFLLAFIIVFGNALLTYCYYKILHKEFTLFLLGTNVVIGGPTTASSFAISYGYNEYISSCIIVGSITYVFGNYAGLIISYFNF